MKYLELYQIKFIGGKMGIFYFRFAGNSQQNYYLKLFGIEIKKNMRRMKKF